MAKMIGGEVYLSPLEASAMLCVSYKTLQRWTESGRVQAWTGATGKRKRISRRIRISYIRTPSGYRYYDSRSIKALAAVLQGIIK